jgi:hypothetical protein
MSIGRPAPVSPYLVQLQKSLFGWLDSIEADHLCTYGGAFGGERDLPAMIPRQQLGRTGWDKEAIYT